MSSICYHKPPENVENNYVIRGPKNYIKSGEFLITSELACFELPAANLDHVMMMVPQ